MINKEPVILTQLQLEERLAYWQKRLRLQDWLITVEVCRMREIDGSQARNHYQRVHKMARIYIGDETDYSPIQKHPLDMEWNLVHELLHLHFDALLTFGELATANEELPRLVYQETEAAIDCIAFALVMTNRQTVNELNEFMRREREGREFNEA